MQDNKIFKKLHCISIEFFNWRCASLKTIDAYASMEVHYAQNETSSLEHDEWILAADNDYLGQTYDTPN